MEGCSGRAGLSFGHVSAAHWARARHLLLPALAWAEDSSEDDVVAALRNGTAQLWIGEDDQVRCGVVTCLSGTPQGLICEIWLMGGRDRHRWLHFLDVIEAAARERGCFCMELTGRRGWGRLLPQYRPKAFVFRKVF